MLDVIVIANFTTLPRMSYLLYSVVPTSIIILGSSVLITSLQPYTKELGTKPNKCQHPILNWEDRILRQTQANNFLHIGGKPEKEFSYTGLDTATYYKNTQGSPYETKHIFEIQKW